MSAAHLGRQTAEPWPLGSCVAEVASTFPLVLFGPGAVASVVLTGAQVGLWQMAVI